MQAYQDAWLKLRYPFEFYAVLLSLEPEKTLRAIKEMIHFGVEVVNPDVNASKKDFTIDFENRCIRYGLIGIDGIGETSANQCMEKAPYESLEHFQMSHSFKYSRLNRGHQQALLESGALDSLGARGDWTEEQKAVTEMRRLKFSARKGATFGEHEDIIVSNVHTEDEVEALAVDARVVVAGRATDVRRTVTKKGRNPGQEMAMVRIRLGLDSFDCVVFPPVFALYGDLLEVGAGLLFKGRKDSQSHVIVDGVMTSDDFITDKLQAV